MSSSVMPPRDRFASLLGGAVAPGAFSARRTARPDDLRLEVRGVGPITLPVTIKQAKELCLVARPAQFGKGEETLLDAGVRDTWEVPKSRVRIDKRQWNVTLKPMLERLRAGLGLPPECELTADLHSMLVYAPGQFFAPHQDSEKVDGMVGTLVVTLPSGATGGVLTVEHAGATATYRASKETLSFVAFYADCRHHVRPVTSGYRVVLTYNLLLKGDPVAAATSRTDQGLVAELAGCLDGHFGRRDEPARLVYLLDHEYTQRALGWARLKGSDASRAAAVRAAADAADCEATLALVEVHETWDAYEDEPHGRYWDYNDDETEDDDEDGEADYQVQDLIESSTTLDCWLDESGETAATSLTVFDEEVCATTPTGDLTPRDSSYEGYMGNWGNTLDRWYRRAAIVLWPRRWAFAVRAEASPEWALDQMAGMARADDLAGAREGAATLPSFWARVAGGAPLLGKTLTVARDLDEPKSAAMLLAPFRAEMLTAAHGTPLARLVVHYGEPWTRDLVEVWFGRDRRMSWSSGQETVDWLGSLPALCRTLSKTPAGELTARLLSAGAWPRLRDSADMALRLGAPSQRHQALGDLGPSFAGLLAGTTISGATDLHDTVAAFLCQDNDDLIACAMSTLRGRTKVDLDVVVRHCAARLETRLAWPVRADDDWSITPPAGCACDLCQVLGGFLGDPVRRSFEWPLAKEGRHHVHQRIDAAELPVRHETRRTGRPYTLVLAKTDDIFQREQDARKRDRADLTWLRRRIAVVQ